jgi:hypothetical protein
MFDEDAGRGRSRRRPSSCSVVDEGWNPPVVLPPLVQRDWRRHRAKGSVFAFAPTFALRGTSSTKSSGAEDVARWWRRCPRSKWFCGGFDVTIDGRGTVGLRVSRSVASCVYKGGGAAWVRYSFCAPQNPTLLLKPFVRSPALLAPTHRRSGPRQVDRSPPLTVRSHAVLFLICSKYTAGWRVVRRHFEQHGGGGVTSW